jgi:hypothetical protein
VYCKGLLSIKHYVSVSGFDSNLSCHYSYKELVLNYGNAKLFSLFVCFMFLCWFLILGMGFKLV